MEIVRRLKKYGSRPAGFEPAALYTGTQRNPAPIWALGGNHYNYTSGLEGSQGGFV
jgi:hypothetical protein